MAKVVLKQSRIRALVGQFIATAVAQHVRVGWQGKARPLTVAPYQVPNRATWEQETIAVTALHQARHARAFPWAGYDQVKDLVVSAGALDNSIRETTQRRQSRGAPASPALVTGLLRLQ